MSRFLPITCVVLALTPGIGRGNEPCPVATTPPAQWLSVGGPPVNGYQISLQGPTTPIKLDQPIPLLITVRNVLATRGVFPWSPIDETIRIIIVDASGKQIGPVTSSTAGDTSATNYVLYYPCDAITWTIPLQDWVKIIFPGAYSVVAVFYQNDPGVAGKPFTMVSNPIVVIVEPATSKPG